MEDAFDIDDGETFMGEHIGSIKIKVCDLVIPDSLIRIYDVVDYYRGLQAVRRPFDEILRHVAGSIWELKPRPDFFTVHDDKKCRYLSLLRDDFCRLSDLLCIAPDPLQNSLHVKAEKTYISKPNLLIKTLFHDLQVNRNISVGPPSVERFRKRCEAYTQIVAIDFEAFELAQNFLLELGISIYTPATNSIRVGHIVFEENSWRRNGAIVVDNRDSFLFGPSTVLSQDNITQFLYSIFSDCRRSCLVGHALQGDINMLRQCCALFDPADIDQYDTQEIYRLSTASKNHSRLEALIIDLLDTQPTGLHNAGNDAYFTLRCFLALVGIEPLEDIQRFSISKPVPLDPESSEPLKSPRINGNTAVEPIHPPTTYHLKSLKDNKFGKSRWM